jgi:1-acyl-sn-glycerol-3-phosphate acyltransferase
MISRFLYRIAQIIIRAYAVLLLRMDVCWHSPLPKGPVLFAANHPSTTDPIFVHLLTRQPVRIMITNKAFSIPVLGTLMRKVNHISVIPGKGEEVLEEARQALARGQSVMIFPEGLVSPEDGFHAPRSGVARLALKAGVPVVPLGISLARKGCRFIPAVFDGQPDIITWYLHGPYAITIGRPLYFQGDANDKPAVRGVAEKIMEHIRSLAGESRKRVWKAM